MRLAIMSACAFTIIALLTVVAYQNYRRFHRPLTTTTYQAVTLTNGNVFYGRIDHLGSDHPVLRDAFSIRHERDDRTEKQRYVLVSRKDEANGAYHMIFPVSSIAFIEPVRADSTIGKLIEQADVPR